MHRKRSDIAGLRSVNTQVLCLFVSAYPAETQSWEVPFEVVGPDTARGVLEYRKTERISLKARGMVTISSKYCVVL